MHFVGESRQSVHTSNFLENLELKVFKSIDILNWKPQGVQNQIKKGGNAKFIIPAVATNSDTNQSSYIVKCWSKILPFALSWLASSRLEREVTNFWFRGLRIPNFFKEGSSNIIYFKSEGSNEYTRLTENYKVEFVTSSSCGGLVEGPAGGIEYKLFQDLTPNEICIWTVHMSPNMRWFKSNSLKTVSIQELYILNGTYLPGSFDRAHTYIRTRDRKPYNIIGGSAIQVAFTTSMNDQRGQGFSLVWEGVGNRTDQISKPLSYKLMNPVGLAANSVRYPVFGNLYPTKEIIAIVIHPDIQKKIALTLTSFEDSNWGASRYKHYGCSGNYNMLIISEVHWGIGVNTV